MYNVQDANGNPVANTPVALTPAAAGATNAHSNPWITSVNGQTLSQTFGSNSTSEHSPIPLYGPSGDATAYNSVVVLGVVTYGAGGTTAYTNAQGQVTLTLSDGGVSYYVWIPVLLLMC